MKKSIKRFAVTLFATGFVLSGTFTSLAGWEQQADGAWKYKRENGDYLAKGLYAIALKNHTKITRFLIRS